MAYRPLPPPGLYKRPVFEPQCTHLSMTRLYDQTAICCNCRRPGPFGWVYQCIQDREEALEEAAARGELTAFDDLGRFLGSRLRVRERSPAARQDSLSFFKEITSEQMSQYTPQQIATILRQRETVHIAIESDRIRVNNATILSQAGRHNFDGSSANGYTRHPLWVRSASEECRYWICPNCRPSAADRAFLSMNAVAQGEIVPTAAMGYGFHVLGERPVVNANVVKNIGCRAVPRLKYDYSFDTSSFDSDLSVMELLDHQIAQSQLRDAKHCSGSADTGNDGARSQYSESEAGHLKHSPGCDNLANCSERNTLIRRWPFERPPRESSLPAFVHDEENEQRMAKGYQADGQSSEKSFIPLTTAACRYDLTAQTPRSVPTCAQTLGQFHSLNRHLGPRSSYEDKAAPDAASGNEGSLLATGGNPDLGNTAASANNDNGGFAPTPLKVGQGVAVLEESVELGVPDVITQV